MKFFSDSIFVHWSMPLGIESYETVAYEADTYLCDFRYH